MRKLPLALALALAGSGGALAQPPPAPDLIPDPRLPVYVTAHVDVTSDHIADAIKAIEAYVTAARHEVGALRIDAIEERRPNHFDLIEVWRDRAAFDAHARSPAAIRFHDAVFPWRGSPFEERLGTAIVP